MSRSVRLLGQAASLVLLTLLLVGGVFATVGAQEEAPGGDGMDRLIADGRLVYEANCSACHQLDGSGRSGVFPPLLDNPSVDDTDYLRTVIREGLQGEIEVLGVTYNGAMSSFALLGDEQVTALIAYLQEGLGAPVPAPAPGPGPGGTDDGGLSSGARLVYTIGALVVLVAIGIGVRPLVLARTDGGTLTTAQSWIKSGAIVLYFILATVFIPSMVVESSLLASTPSVLDDVVSDDLWDTIRSLIGAGVWLVAFGLGVWGLRRGQRNRVI